MTDRAKSEVLVGKYFMATDPHEDGIVEAVVNEDYYLVRFRPPEAFAVVALSDMARDGSPGHEDQPPPWLVFDSAEQPAKARTLVSEPDPPDTPRIPPM